MNRIPQVQLENLEKQILALDEYGKIEITNTKGKVQVIVRSTRKVAFEI